MNYKNLFHIPLLAIAVMSSCSIDNELGSTKSEYINFVRVTVEDFQPESLSTRTAYTVDASGFHFQWADGDALGIYPVGGDQVKFPISNGDGSATALFDGGAWKLRSEYQYAAYYPFSVDNYKIDQKALPVSFTGQTQNGNASTAHLGAYDYLACAASAPNTSGGVDLTMKHLGAFLRLQLTMPKADTYSSVVLESDGAKFVTAGTFDLTAATPAITPTATSSTYTINLTNVSTTEEKQIITIYAIVAPANLSTSNITVTIHGTGKTTYVQTVQGKNFAARSAYNIAVETFPSGTNASGEDVSWEEPENNESGHEWVDLGLSVKWATCNVGASKPEEYGDYFAWGETIGTESGKTSFSWDSYFDTRTVSGYNYKGEYIISFNKYPQNSNNLSTVLTPEDDAASVNWGSQWRIPTFREMQELVNNCNWEWVTSNGINGYKVTSKENGKFIFLPAAGWFGDIGLSDYGTDCRYWMNTMSPYYNYAACILSCNSTNGGNENTYQGTAWRCRGFTVRPVCP